MVGEKQILNCISYSSLNENLFSVYKKIIYYKKTKQRYDWEVLCRMKYWKSDWIQVGMSCYRLYECTLLTLKRNMSK